MEAFIAKQAEVKLIAWDLFQAYGHANLENQGISYFAESEGNYIRSGTDLKTTLAGEFKAWCAMLQQYVPVSLPSVEVKIFLDHNQHQPIKTLEVPIYVLRTFIEPDFGLTGLSILKLIDTHFGGWSGQVEKAPFLPPAPLNAEPVA